MRKSLSSGSIEKCADADEDIACDMDEGGESVQKGSERQQGTLVSNRFDSEISNGA